MQMLRHPAVKATRTRFSAALLIAGSILPSCMPKEQPKLFPPPDCSDMTMTVEQIDACWAAKESFVPLYPVTRAEAADRQPDAGPAMKVAIPPGCAENMSRVGPFCIDRYEAYVVSVSSPEGTAHPFNEPLGSGRFIAKSAPGVFPQAHISGEQASDACMNAGKRLCTMAEWQSACMGSRGFAYPYGNEKMSGTCNSGKRWGPGLLSGGPSYNLNDPRLNLLEGGLARSGEYDLCVSDHNVYDMVGNLHEWVSTRVDQSMVGSGKTNIPGLYVVAGNGIFMGGFYTLDASCRYKIIAHPFSHYDYSTGFRCCMDPKK
ncbi:MAG: SUMF1/EgtB/PvdO family nonheme iron enzyme [Candidatus Micrarchaeia archaeon]